MKKQWICMIVAAMMVTGGALGAAGCSRNKQSSPASMEATLSVTDRAVQIGVDGVQTWKFRKAVDGGWSFDGVYANVGGSESRVFVGTTGRLGEDDRLDLNGAYFTVQRPMDAGDVGSNLSGFVDEITVVKDEPELKEIRLAGQGFVSTLAVSDGEAFVRRDFEITLPAAAEVFSSEISFTLKTEQDAFHEYGYILTHANDETQTTVPYSFPAITSKLTSRHDSGRQFTYTEVMDWYATDDCFKVARRNEHLNGFMDLGVLCGDATLAAATTYRLSERILVRDGSRDDYYDMIGEAKEEYADIYAVPFELLTAANANMNVETWTDAAYGAKYDILDGRGRPLGDDIGTWGPYGYQNGGAEAFGATDILKGIIRYAVAVGDTELYDAGLKYLLQMIEPDANGQSYIMPLNKYPQYAQYSSDMYFYRACNGSTYAAEDSWDSKQPRIGSFKYYTRVLNLGELALVTGNEKVKAAFMSLMPLVKKMRGADFEQAVEWNFDMTPALDFENGGSGGAAAMWAQIMYTASLIETDAAAREDYLRLMKGAVARSNAQGFPRSSSLREYPKPESIGYAIRANLELFELTGDADYRDSALGICRGLYFYYFQNTHPYTYYQTVGYGYACARERWEAFMEMVESAVLTTPILAYTDDPLYLDLLAQVKNSALWTLPVNGYPDGYLGGHSDWTDALYVPFEQPTGAMGDNPGWDGGGASYLRHSKELYGAGEIFTGALTFETFGRTDEPCVSLFNYTAATGVSVDRTAQKFRVYNASAEPKTAALIFTNFDAGRYEVSIDGAVYGAFDAAELAGGFDYTLDGRDSKLVEVTRVGTGGAAATPEDATTAVVQSSVPAFTELALGGTGATHWTVEVSASERFDADTATVRTVRAPRATLTHEDDVMLYVRVTGYTAFGKALSPARLTVHSGVAEIGCIEDFGYENPGEGSIGGWQASARNYDGAIRLTSDTNGFKDYPASAPKAATGYMAVYKPVYAGEDTDTFVKTFRVDLGRYPYFEFFPYTKNIGCAFSLTLSVGDRTVTVIDAAQSFDRAVYRCDLSAYAAGTADVRVTMVSSGFNRGFAINRLRFTGAARAYEGARDLTRLAYSSDVGVAQEDGLRIVNPADLTTIRKQVYELPAFDAADYSELEIPLAGVTNDLSGKVYAEITIRDGSQNVVYTASRINVSFGQALSVPLADFPSGARAYSLTLRFVRRFGGEEVTVITPRAIRVNSDLVTEYLSVTKLEDGEHVLDGWRTNWAYSDPEGYIYNANPSVAYGSIYREGITVDLDQTPVMRFRVSAVKAGTQYSLKANDGTMAEDIALIGQTDKTGVFTVNLRDRLGRGGVMNLRLDFYVVHEAAKDGGAKLENIEILAGRTLYENTSQTVYSETVSETLEVDLDATPYICLDVADLSYGSKWLIYAEYEGQRYELKTVYEAVYGKMYYRAKEGAFKYDLRDVLPVASGRAAIKLIVMVDGENAELALRGFRLSDNNETPVLKRSAAIR